jgi:peptidoglycan lytic transglycosylase G
LGSVNAELVNRVSFICASLVCALVVAGAASARPAATTEPTLKITFPEGWSVRQMVDRVAVVRQIAIRKRGITPRLTGLAYKQAAAAARAPAAFRPYLKRRSSEGFLFPSTYHFTATTSAERLVANQIAAFEERWRTVDLRVARQRQRTPYDVLVIASMVERETVVPGERRLVAAVIYNRLERGMPLAIDATIRYGLGVPGTRPLTRAHLRSDSPYNTRRFKGLPPTPIGNPGLASMRAAAAPAAVDYLYYVRKPDDKHHFFTADEEEFCRKAREYGYGC